MILISNNNFVSNECQDFWGFYCRELFEKFRVDFKENNILDEAIKFYKIWLWFSFKKISKHEAKSIVQYWIDNKFCILVVYRGLKFLEKKHE